MSLERDKSRLDRIASQLYSRNAKEYTPQKNAHLTNHDVEAPSDWNTPEPEYDGPDDLRAQAGMSSLAKKFFLFALVFFVVAAGVAAYVYYQGNNIISASNIDIVITGPATIAGGEKLDLDLQIKNENSIQIEKADLNIEYPEGTRNADDVSIEQTRQYRSIGPIAPSGTASANIRAILYGEENSKQKIKAILSYRVKGSNALLEKEKEFEVFLTTAPVSIKVSSLKEVNSGQEVEFSVDLISNSPNRLNGVLLKADYGFGFTMTSASPKTTYGKDTWLLGDIRPGEKRTVKIRGKIEGQDGEERTFRFSGGIQSERNETLLEPVFVTVSQTVAIQKPFIGVELALNGDTSPIYSSQAGRRIRADLQWINNLPLAVSNVKIQAKITGEVFNRTAVSVDQGFYRSVDNTIVWDKGEASGLALVNPGDSGRVGFEFATSNLDPATLSKFKNGELTIDVSVSGKRSESNVPEEVLSTVTKKVRLSSELAVVPRIVYTSGPFTNIGPVPAKAEKETTYTVILAVTNSTNDVRDVRVTANLPSYVKWLGKTSPESEDIAYNQTGGEIVWDVNDVPAGQGYLNQPRQVAFQISFVPSISQVDTIPVLVNSIAVDGIDRFTNAKVGSKKPDLTTRLATDPTYANTSPAVLR
jgi:hypothetical protein